MRKLIGGAYTEPTVGDLTLKLQSSSPETDAPKINVDVVRRPEGFRQLMNNGP